jgi:hypothetical protein
MWGNPCLLGETLPPEFSESRSFIIPRHPTSKQRRLKRRQRPRILSNGREVSNALFQACFQWFKSKRVSGAFSSSTRFQRFLATLPFSLFKKLIISTPRLVHVLCTMSIAKAVPDGIKDQECKRFALQECLPPPYVSEKDSIQGLISLLKSNQSLKRLLGLMRSFACPSGIAERARRFSCM